MQEKVQRPILAASAAVFKDQSILLVKRGREPGRGKWSLPGGKIAFGETALAAAGRELLEETGIHARLTGFAGLYEIIDQKTHFAIACYTGRFEAGEVRAASDADEARFVLLADISQFYIVTTAQEAITAARLILGI